MRRATAALALAGALVLTGCAPLDDNGDGTVTMPWWYFWQQQQQTTTTPGPTVTRSVPGTTPQRAPAQQRQAPAPRPAPAPYRAPARSK